MSARPLGAWLLAAGAIAVLASLAAAIAVIGTPAQQRRMRFDEARVRDLERLQLAIAGYRRDEGRLPPRLDAIARLRRDTPRDDRDPETGAPYGYRIIEGDRYALCAVFALPTPDSGRWADPDWRHPAGRHCFSRRIGATAGDPAEKAAAAAAIAAESVSDVD